MRPSTLIAVSFAALSAAGPVIPRVGNRVLRRQADNVSNPFDGKKLFVNPTYAEKLDQTVESFKAAGDTANAEKTRAIQDIGTFVWVSDVSSFQTQFQSYRELLPSAAFCLERFYKLQI